MAEIGKKNKITKYIFLNFNFLEKEYKNFVQHKNMKNKNNKNINTKKL